LSFLSSYVHHAPHAAHSTLLPLSPPSPTPYPTLQVLQVALRADAEPAHPYDLVAVWLAALAWVADARWRRLTTGPHQQALMAWLEALELRVVALSLSQPEDFLLEGSGGCMW